MGTLQRLRHETRSQRGCEKLSDSGHAVGGVLTWFCGPSVWERQTTANSKGTDRTPGGTELPSDETGKTSGRAGLEGCVCPRVRGGPGAVLDR